MRKVKIVNDGFLENKDGHIIECPMKFKQCHDTCAWFGIAEYNDPNSCVCCTIIIGELIA